MSNLANYSPYNKTYKFLMFQNQAYHQKNKITAKPCVKTNIRYPRSAHSNSFYNPQIPKELYFSYQKPSTRSTNRCQSPSQSQAHSALHSSQEKRSKLGIRFSQPRRVVHKNHSFQKFRQKKIDSDNGEMVSRLIGASCEIVKNKDTHRTYRKHQKYSNIRAKYDNNGRRKDVLAVGNQKLLNPTLSEFNKSLIGEKFLDLDMSIISKVSSPMNSPMLKGRRNVFSNQQ